MAGQSAKIADIGTHSVFITTSTSSSPVTDVRCARISCTSQRYGSLGVGDSEDFDDDVFAVLDILSR